MAGGAQRGDVVRTEVLHLVDEDPDAHAHVGRQAAEVGEQLDQVDLDVAGVGAALHCGDADAGVPAFGELGARLGVALDEGADLAEDLVGVGVAELADGHVQGRAEGPAQRLVGAGLELAGAPAGPHRLAAQGVEQDGLADAAQAREDE